MSDAPSYLDLLNQISVGESQAECLLDCWASATPNPAVQKILTTIDYKSFEDESWEDRIPVVGKGLGVLLDQGVYEGNAFLKFMRDLLAEKDVHTFGDLKKKQKDPERANESPLQVIASDLSARKLLVLPRDAGDLGIDPDELEVAFAVRMSMSIPIFFEPVMHRNPRTGLDHLIVDGGMLSNFPVWLFDTTKGEPPRWPTFGMLLVEADPKVPVAHRVEARESGSIIDYVKALASTMMEAHDRLYLEKATFVRTIPIPTLGVSTTEFEITPERIRALYESGRRAAFDFLDRWDFEAYKAEYRSGREHSRREELATRPAAPLSAPPSGGLARA